MMPGMMPIPGLSKYVAEAVDYTASAYLQRGALSGVSNGAVGSLSVWLKFSVNGTSQNILSFDGGSYVSTIGRLTNNRMSFTLRSTGNVFRVSIETSAAFTIAAGWINLLASWSTSSAAHVYVNDVSDISTSSNSGSGTIGYATTCRVGAGAGATGLFTGDMAEFWFDPTTQIDFSVEANRRFFIDALGKPVGLGSTGQLPTGSTPAVYLKGPASNWGTNSGAGGDFNVNGGPFTDATTSPSD